MSQKHSPEVWILACAFIGDELLDGMRSGYNYTQSHMVLIVSNMRSIKSCPVFMQLVTNVDRECGRGVTVFLCILAYARRLSLGLIKFYGLHICSYIGQWYE